MNGYAGEHGPGFQEEKKMTDHDGLCAHNVPLSAVCPACNDQEVPAEQKVAEQSDLRAGPYALAVEPALEVRARRTKLPAALPPDGVALVKVRRLAHAPDQLTLLQRATPGSAGFDLVAAERVVVPAQDMARVATGLELEIQPGFEGQVRPRSGLAEKGITVANAPGTIDSDYRKEVIVVLYNRSKMPFQVMRGDRIAQLIIAKLADVIIAEVDELSPEQDRKGGFGSTGR